MQSPCPWTVSGYDWHVPETFTRTHNQFSCGSVEDSITIGTEHTVYTSRDDVEIPDLNDFYVGHVSSPTNRPPEKTRVGSPNDRGIPRSSCQDPKDKWVSTIDISTPEVTGLIFTLSDLLRYRENIVGLVQCGWQGCTNSSFIGRDLSLWRHIKEKHIRPDAFKCPAPKCKRSYGRMDKLNEHLRSHEDKKVQKPGQNIRSSMAWPCTESSFVSLLILLTFSTIFLNQY